MDEAAKDKADLILKLLKERGIPNYYGEQRFGINEDNAIYGRKLLLREKVGKSVWKKRWLRQFLLNSYQSFLFNEWLAERIQRDWFSKIFEGDIAKKLATGGLFDVTEVDKEQIRFQNAEITYTGPIYGFRMRKARGEPGKLEDWILNKAGITESVLKRAKLRGNRRTARFFLKDFDITEVSSGLQVSFTLPKAAYATILLREFIKPSV